MRRLLSQLSNKRSEILHGLEGKGALEDFLALQRDLADLEAHAASLRERFKAAEALESESTLLKLDRVDLKRRLQIDHHDRSDLINTAILIVAAVIDELYDDRSGGLVIDATDNGPEFRINIEGDRGGGISNVEIFCFDLALYELASRFGGPGFLIHDSHLFDGVDERQVALALCIGQKTMHRLKGQYIVTMNSDIFNGLPLPVHMEREKIVLSTKLSDQTETGGLFGFRFN